jgi:hypothetical protein
VDLPAYRLLTFAAALVVTLAAGFLMIRCNRSTSTHARLGVDIGEFGPDVTRWYSDCPLSREIQVNGINSFY